MAYIVPIAVATALGLTANAVSAFNSSSKGPNRISTVPFEAPTPPVALKPKARPRKASGNGSSSAVSRAGVVNMTTSRLRAPIANSAISRNRVPRSVMGFNGLTITHCEPFASTTLNALGTLSYQTQSFIPSIFPYLSGIASNFSKFSWLKLHVYYVPSCPTSTEGEQALGLFYDKQDALAATFIQTAQMKGGISFPPWGGGPEAGADAITIDVDVKDFDKPRYNYIAVAAFNALSNSDKNNYCPVTLALASQGSTAAVALSGRIWVSYTVRLIDPIPAGVNA